MFSLKKIAPKLWHLHFDKQYDMAMHLLRFQEYRGNIIKYSHLFFTIAEFEKEYKKFKKTKTFTYPKDWEAFCTPSDAFEPFLKNPAIAFPDRNVRDDLMLGIIKTIKSIEGKTFYIINTFGKKISAAYKHEIAHALYYINKNYQKKMQKNISEIDKTKLDKLYKILIKKSYADDKKILDNELQAYIATEIFDEMEKFLSKKIQRKFVATFKQYYKYPLKK